MFRLISNIFIDSPEYANEITCIYVNNLKVTYHNTNLLASLVVKGNRQLLIYRFTPLFFSLFGAKPSSLRYISSEV